MICIKPIFHSKVVGIHGCGQCVNCRINKRRQWTARILMEHASARVSSFVTLTYDGDHVPLTDQALVTLRKRDLSAFLKRLRKRAGSGLRFFGCGEYGDTTWRPHYHAVLFGLDPVYGENLVHQSWGQGFTTTSELNPARAAYVASYTVKKLTKVDDVRLVGQEPEFALMSRRPGIGAPYIPRLVKLHQTLGARMYIDEQGDIPGVVRIGGRVLPLDPYMTGKVREALGIKPTRAERARTHEAQRAMVVGSIASDGDVKGHWRRNAIQIHDDIERLELLDIARRAVVQSEKAHKTVRGNKV